MEDSIRMLHGSGGEATSRLIKEIIAAEFGSNAEEDAAVVTVPMAPQTPIPVTPTMETEIAPAAKAAAVPADSIVPAPSADSGNSAGPASTAGSADSAVFVSAAAAMKAAAKAPETGTPAPEEAASQAPVRIAMTTDSFVVTPLIYPGGDIGRLSICGTVNDLLCRGAVPEYLTCGMILEEGFSVDTLKKISHSMAETAKEAGVRIVAGDTKVVEGRARSGQSAAPDGSPAPDTNPAAAAAGVAHNSSQAPVAAPNLIPAPDTSPAAASGIFINTAGIGFIPAGTDISAAGARDGDSIILTGFLGDHHAAILSARLSMETEFQSDNAPLVEIANALRPFRVHTLRDVTRGGLATVLSELAEASGKSFVIEEERLPVSPAIRDFCGILGLDPLYMGNEGKLVVIVDSRDEGQALSAIRNCRYGENAAVIGRVTSPEGISDSSGSAFLKTLIGGLRRLSTLRDEGLPRIC